MRTRIMLLVLLLPAVQAWPQSAMQKFDLESPLKKLKIDITVQDSVTYAVTLGGKAILLPSAIAMDFGQVKAGNNAVVSTTRKNNARGEITLPYGQSAKLRNDYNELEIQFKNYYSITFRAYDEGIAYRFSTDFTEPVKVVSELATFRLAGDPEAVFPESDVFTSWEVPYIKYKSVSAMAEGKKAISPALFGQPGGAKIVIAESDLLDYPGMYLQKNQGTIRGTWAPYPAKTGMGSWGNFVSVVKERKDYLAETGGKRSYPWRIIIATEQEKELLTNQLVYKLAAPGVATPGVATPGVVTPGVVTPGTIQDFSWVKPGKAAWEWWHDAMLPGSETPSGMKNRGTALYKRYIDFAADSQLEYLMIDAGWSDVYDLKKVKPETDVRELVRYAKGKHVNVFLWCVASTLLNDLEGNLDFIRSIGAVGIKVDFFDRDDQLAIQWFEKIAKAAADRHLMIDFHGCSKPTGLERKYPNIVNYEAVRGAECSKWDLTANPDQHLLTPFIRMVAGPLDYTPGSMRNTTKETFKPVDPGLPSTQGTRCHELAMFVIFNQPLAMLCDSPTEYTKYPDIMQFLSAVPTVFDETKVLDGKVGEYAVMAKKKAGNWYIGAMTNWDARTVELDFSFLPDRKTYQVSLYTDASDAGTEASHYTFKTIQVTRKTRLKLPLAKGGGAVAMIHP
ncbi:glycoside hydrolase family 97 protein [Dyadobacter sp. CY261]|uniref:glycoside hydrolase family 97 catalytic domain-containing protein n=1 Tax=Dyadobacter sp. CY261 TaxID=2907203 RepID=UPI001F48E77D|nr:glycoside hydrolase family 97 catalytic domain-containing protein [Dyadobacter sp. CY261]MCF0069346.1 glycoside hydrolase family 97 protein [Dyadobacter sp. CY261]